MDLEKLDSEAALKPHAPVPPVRPAAAPTTPGAEGETVSGSAGDRVEISDEARARAQENAGADEEVPSGTLSPERLLELRRRIQARIHDSPEVLRTVAQRILEAGDV